MGAPLESLEPTDTLVRGFVHESRQEFGPAKTAVVRAVEGIVHSRVSGCVQESNAVSPGSGSWGRPGPIVDLASGRGSLLEVLLPGTSQEFVGTDISPRVLLRDRKGL